MEEDVLFPIYEAEKIVKGFEDGSLPNDEWTHEAHLIVALSLLARFGDTAFEEMKNRLIVYNKIVGRDGTFRADLTSFWLEAVKERLGKNGKVAFNQTTVDDLLFDEDLADRNLFFRK